MSYGDCIVAGIQINYGRLGSAALGLINHLFIALVSVRFEFTVLIQVDPNCSPIIVSTNFPPIRPAHFGMEYSVEEAQVVVVPGYANPCIPIVVVVIEIQPPVSWSVCQRAGSAWGKSEHVFNVGEVFVLDGLHETVGIELALGVVTA